MGRLGGWFFLGLLVLGPSWHARYSLTFANQISEKQIYENCEDTGIGHGTWIQDLT